MAGTDLNLNNQDDAIALAEKVYLQNQRMKDAKNVLKAWNLAKGPIYFGDMEYGPKISQKITINDMDGALNRIIEK